MRRIQQSKRFSQATISKNHIYLTGQVAIDNPNGTIGEQTMEVLNRKVNGSALGAWPYQIMGVVK